MLTGVLGRTAATTAGVLALAFVAGSASASVRGEPDGRQQGGCGGAWRSYGADLVNSRSQHAPGAVGVRTARRLRLDWAIRGSGLASGNPPTLTASPAVSGCVAYFGDWRGYLAAVSIRSGHVLWSTQVDSAPFPFTPVNSSPALQRGSVFASTGDGHVVAVSRRSGRILWSTLVDPHAGTVLYSSPVVLGRTLVVGVSSVQNALQSSGYDFRGSIVGLDTRTGRIRWRTWVMRPGLDGPGGSVWSSAAIDRRRQLAYIGTGQAYAKPSGPRNDALLALRLRDGRVAWKRQFTRTDVYTFFGGCCDYDIGASPNLFQVGRRAVVGVGDKAGRYAVLDRDTGQTVWRRSLCPGSHLGGVMTTAAVARGSIWVSCNRFAPAALSPFPNLEHPGNRTDVFALDAATGATRWRRRVAGVTLGALAEAGGAVFVPNASGRLRAWSATGGRLLWSARPGGPLGGGVTVAAGRLLVGYGDFAGPTQPPDSTGGLAVYSVKRR
jgi:polyvinyl alcohol dehydrogenase (cytochrome)